MVKAALAFDGEGAGGDARRGTAAHARWPAGAEVYQKDLLLTHLTGRQLDSTLIFVHAQSGLVFANL